MSEDTRLIEAIIRVTRDLRTHYDATAQEVGLTLSRARVVTNLAKNEGATQTELAETLGIEAPALKRQVDALVAAGFIERRGLDGDARKKALFLTERARSSKISGFIERLREDLTEGIPEKDQKIAQAVLERIAENAERLVTS